MASHFPEVLRRKIQDYNDSPCEKREKKKKKKRKKGARATISNTLYDGPSFT